MMQQAHLAEPSRSHSDTKDTEPIPKSDPGSGVISIDPERMGGTPCFVGTRVPIRHLWDYLEEGSNLDDFLDGFPGVTREQCVAALEMAYTQLLEELPDAVVLK